MSEGAIRVDPHVKVLGERVVARAKSRDIDALVYAPHFVRLPEIERRAAAASDDLLTVIPAREVFTGSWRDRKHVLALGLSEPVPDYITLEAAMAELARQDAAALIPHPTFASVSFGPRDLRRYRDQLHGLEIYNPKHLGHHNRRATRLAEDLAIPPFASSYAHLPGTVGEVWTQFPGVAPTEAAIVTAIRDGNPRTTGHRRSLSHRLRCRLEFAHLFYENSLAKVAGFVRGPKPTNPHHPAYGGRFEEEAVYPAWRFTKQ